MTFTTNLDPKGVMTVTLNRPEVHNAFNDEMIASLTEAFLGFSKDPDIHVVVLQGAGKSFCAGADLNWMKRMKDYSKEENFRDSVALSRMFQAINFCRKPVVASVHGAALGGGVGLVACCDYVVASEDAVFGLTETKLGLLPAVISPFVIAKIGESRARAYFLTAERFNSTQAKEMGLIHQISLDRYFQADTDKIVNALLGVGPKARELAKDLIFNVRKLMSSSDFTPVEDFTCRLISEVRTSSEGQEGMAALLEKRKPQWKK